ncbi:MAG TPA: kelch repeat-containing protein [Gemmatimonadales bacterium]
MRRLAMLALVLAAGLGACRDETTAPGPEPRPQLGRTMPTERTGWFHIRWGDPREGRGPAQVRHELVDERGQGTELVLDPSTLARVGGPLALNRKRVRVRGETVAGGRLQVESIELEAGPGGAMEAAAGVPRIGSFAYVTIGCKFADIATVPRALATYQTWTAGTSYPGLNHHWPEQSFTQMNVTGSSASGWYTLPQPQSYYVTADGTNLDALASDCIGAADGSVSFPQYYGINMQFNASLGCCSWGGSWTLTLDGQTRTYGITWMADWSSVSVYAHEEGHSLGLPHSSGPYTETYDSRWDVMSNASAYFDAAQDSYIPEHTISYHKDLLGWIPAARKLALGSNTTRTITLERLAQPGSGNYLMATIPIDNAPGQFYTVEARRVVGSYDGHLPADAVVLHRVNPTLADRVAQVVDPDNNGDPNDAGAAWIPGETFTDAANGITVTVNAQTSTGFQVTLARGAPPSSDIWTPMARLPAARSAFAAATGNGLGYMAGGRNGTTTLRSVAAYNPGTNSWGSLAVLPNARYEGSGAATINGFVYVPGGRNGTGSVTRSLFAYNISTNVWSTKAAMPVPSACGGSVTIGGLLYVLTGCDNTSTFKGLLHRYTPSSNTWTTLATAPAPHGYPAVGVISGKLYVAGGKNGAGAATGTLHVYTPGTNQWATRAAMPSARFGAAGAVISGKLYVIGGTDGSAQAVGTTYVYDPATNTWSTKTPMPTARTGLGAAAVAGLVYAIGGHGATSDLRTVERYTP